jgi:hypothetical protein
MTRRSLVLVLGVALVGVVVGYFVGRQSAASGSLPAAVLVVSQPPVVASPPVPPDSPRFEPVLFDRSGPADLLNMKPTRVAKEMSRAEAVAILHAEGFTTPEAASVIGATAAFAARSWQVRKPWMGGYHFVTVNFTGEKVAEVHNFWNDP